jgi:saccharopine dehydrogenase-like NADP-dependent oxidoreductase
MKKVLILGAGLVSRPIITYLLENNYQVTITSLNIKDAESMVKEYPNGKAVEWESDDEGSLERMVMVHDLVVSLLPYKFHVLVAEFCIQHGKHMVTASYIIPEMQALDERAKKAGIIILNELGFDPGLDHMSAKRIIDDAHAKGGEIEAFYSLGGALPAPEFANNPLRYKFTWSPKGVLMAGNSDGKCLRNGEEVFVPAKDIFKNLFYIDFPGVGELVAYPNRDSTEYIHIYSIPEVKTICRATLRYPGWCKTIDAMKELDLISYQKIDLKGMTYAGLMAKLIHTDNLENIRAKVAAYLNLNEDSVPLEAMEWLGLFDNSPIKEGLNSTFDITAELMISKMQLGKEEKDMVVLQHDFLVKYKDGRKEVIRSRMLDFGSPSTDTSIARTVALPAAIGVQQILENKIPLTGVHRPVHPEIYNPILDELEKIGIHIDEERGLPESELPFQ